MNYGGIEFGHVMAFQIKCMMANQYPKLVDAIENYKNDPSEIIAICLRLGWNDAFRHVSKNHTDYDIIKNYKNAHIGTVFNSATSINDDRRDKVIFDICIKLVPYYNAYLSCSNTQNRLNNMNNLMLNPCFCDLIGIYKDIKSAAHPLCIGHIQKMFNMATKLLLCLVISAEQASSNGIQVKLRKNEAKNNDVYLTDNNWWQGIFDEDNFDADCPLDSIILDSIEKRKINNINKSASGHTKYSQIVWSKLGTTERKQNYDLAQNEIKNINAKKHKNKTSCNLLFDFENWN